MSVTSSMTAGPRWAKARSRAGEKALRGGDPFAVGAKGGGEGDEVGLVRSVANTRPG